MGLRQNLAVDLGSSYLKVAVKGKGVVINEPTVVTVKQETGEVLAIGKNAKEMVGKTDAGIITINPIKGSVISEYTVAMNMIGYYLDKAIKNPIRRIFRPDVMTMVPSNVTSVSRRAAERALKEAGAGRIFFVEAPLAAAIGANLDVSAPNGKMVVNIGGDVTDIAVISFDGIVSSATIPVGGNTFDETIKNYFKKEYKMILGDASAEKIKIQYACAHKDVRVAPFEVSAIELQSRMPVEKQIRPDELVRPLGDAIMPINEGIRQVLEKTPPELVSDVYERGILLTGGGSQLAGIDVYISRATGIDTHVAEKPQLCAVKGAMKILAGMSAEKKNQLMEQ